MPLRPTPTSSRPWLILSTVAASSASRSGWHSGRTWTPVPIFMRLVRAAIALARVSGAEHTERSRDMDFRQPHRIEPEPLGGVDLLERDGERLLLAHPGGALELVEHAELEAHGFLALRVATPLCMQLRGVRAPRRVKKRGAARRVPAPAARAPARRRMNFSSIS